MGDKHFNTWLLSRRNQFDEGWRDWFGFGKKKEPEEPEVTEPTKPAITKPSEIYTHPDVVQYYKEIIEHLGLLEGDVYYIDNQGNKGKELGKIPGQVEKALKSFIAGHIFGGSQEKTFLRPSYHDAATIIDFLDHLQKADGSHLTLAQKNHLTDPQQLAYWFQSKLPVAKDTLYQPGYHASKYVRPQELYKKPAAPKFVGMPELANALASFLEMFYKQAAKSGIREPKRTYNAWGPAIDELVKRAKIVFPGDTRFKSMKSFFTSGEEEGEEAESGEGSPGGGIT